MTQDITLINADVIDGLKSIDENSIDTIITSPPYYSLRDYGTDGQIGMEPTLEEFHDRLLDVTLECKRVLKSTGIMFFNMGDSYNEKSLTMQNERLIIRMIDEQGFILRNRIIWHKPNGMPSSAHDRFTNKYEPVYMLTKTMKNYFDLDAVRIPAKYQEVWSRKGSAPGTPYETTGNNPRARWGLTKHEIATDRTSGTYSDPLHTKPVHPSGMKNPGDVWKIPTQPHKDAHFAIFPEKLVEPLVKAGCPKNGIVLDPFAGSGTTMKVAKALGRSAIGIELSEEYCEIIKRNLLFHQYTLGNIVNKFVKL